MSGAGSRSSLARAGSRLPVLLQRRWPGRRQGPRAFLLLAVSSDAPAESRSHALRRGGAAALCWFIAVRGLGPPALEGLFILPLVSGLLARPFVGFKYATVEERPQRLLGALADLLDPDLIEARTDVPPPTAPHLMAVGFGGPAKSVVPIGVGDTFDRNSEDKALVGRLDLRSRPSSLHRP